MKIHFLVIGGGAGGLSAAIALSRAGHRVTVLETEDFFEKTWGTAGGCAITPNMFKLLARWGMETRLKRLATHNQTFSFRRLETGDILGIHLLNQELLRDCGGDFCYVEYTELRTALRETAIASGATMRAGQAVVSISVEDPRPSVTLRSGEILEADVVIAADGPNSVARSVVLEEDVRDTSLKLTVCRMVIPGDEMAREPELQSLLGGEQSASATFTWFGDSRAAIAFPSTQASGSKNTFSLQVYVPEQGTEDWWGKDITSDRLLGTIGQCDPRIRKMIQLAKTAKCLPVARPAALETWVHPSGRLLLMGDTAHAFPMGSLHSLSPSIEDAAALGELFRHLHHDQQIDTFLVAFEEIRAARVEAVLNVEIGRLALMTLPNGEMQQFRDDTVRRNHAKGLDAFAGEDGDLLPAWEVDKGIFAYDAEDHAAEWWNDWGLLEERAREVQIPSSLGSLRVQVDSHSQGLIVV